MSSENNYRLYTFVANLYLSPLQCGLQTAHVVSEIANGMLANIDDDCDWSTTRAFRAWAELDKTVIICGAINHRGVLDCWAELERINSALDLPAALFSEDEDSMNGMATACGVIVPEKYWSAVFERGSDYGGEDRWVSSKRDANGVATHLDVFYETHAEGQFISHIKRYRLA